MTRTPRILALPTAALTLLLLGSCVSTLTPDTTPTPSQNVVTVDAGCEEDMPCWDCERMGNLVCALTEAQKPDAWAAWDKWQGWRQLHVDISRPFKVEASHYALSRPAKTPGTTVIEGEGGKWYIFTVTYTD